MIQELLAGAALIGGERKISINGGVILEGTPSSSPCLSPSPSPSPSSSTTSTVAAATTAAAATNASTPANSENQNLRCPRCDSSNTKFCYYNNYNLTQPRHFCKTCRRYWTKGGALRNVPIGGGCRKNKNSTISSSVSKANATKFKTLASDITRSSLLGGFDHEFSPSPILWASPQNSHILALLRANQNPSPCPSPNPNPLSLKEEVNMIGAHVIHEPGISMGAMNVRNLNIDPAINQLPTLGLCSSFWRNNQVQSPQYLQNQLSSQQQHSVVVEEQNSGIQALYQRLRASTGNYYNDHSPILQSSIATSSSLPSPTLESTPTTTGELTGYWNPTQLCWSDLPTTNGAYP